VTATGEAGATPAAASEPPADLTVTMQDYAFAGLPETVPSGRQIWNVTNQGPEIHMMIVQSAPAGVTLQEILDTFQALGPNGTPAPDAPIQESDFGPTMGQEIIPAGQTAWVELDLAPGSYLVACYMPDDEMGMPHAFMGMAALATVGGASGRRLPGRHSPHRLAFLPPRPTIELTMRVPEWPPLPGARLPLSGVTADEGDLASVVVQVPFGDQSLVGVVSRFGPRNQQRAQGLQPARNGRQEVVCR
jgi:hypothetical protein